ncbi:glycosyltransferase [Leifsonia kafniensis]|uniref:Glycosyltransferase n=1 Tax=Leifsonia kafniensis TaxID=475957 RepID=A0ABP7K4T9_9MICO
MARILVSVMPFAGHVAPILAVVEQLVARGHHVRVYTGSRYLDQFEAVGARGVAWRNAPDFDEHDLHAAFPALPVRTGRRALLGNLEHIFVRSAVGQVADLREAYAAEPWDVMAGDQLCLGIALAGEKLGCPWASISLVPLSLPSRDLPPAGLALQPGQTIAGRLRDRMLRSAFTLLTQHVQKAYEQTRNAVGLPAAAQPLERAWWSPYLICAVGVPALEYPRSDLPPQVHFVGALRRPSGVVRAQHPPWWGDVLSDERPVVYVTQGTLNTDPTELLEPALVALADEDVLVVASTGKRGESVLPFSIPHNARVADMLPYSELLPRLSMMITNGGWGGVLAGLASGVPLIVAGGDIDKPEIAARVAASGAGIDLRTGRPHPAAIARAVNAIRDDRLFGVNAARVAEQLARHDGVREVAQLLERLQVLGLPVVRSAEDPWTEERTTIGTD